MFRPSFIGLTAVVLMAACSDRQGPMSPRANQPALGISDGAHSGGNANFFFLPPIAANPSSNPLFDAGKFNPSLAPTVKICLLKSDLTSCESYIKTFAASEVLVTDEQYHVNWNTKETPLLVSRMYRIEVLVGSTTVGFVDVDPVSSGSQLRAVNTNEYIGLVDGRTLPIKFRLENRVTCVNSNDCAEQSVTNAGATVVTNTGFAGVEFPTGWLPNDPATGRPYTSVSVKIVRVVLDGETPCHSGLRLPQFEGCYQFSTIPDVGLFAKPVIAGICPELTPADSRYNQLVFYTSGAGEETKAAPEAPAPFVHCEGFVTPIVGQNTRLGRMAHDVLALATGVANFLSPKSAYAIDLGVGGEMVEFSRGGWVQEQHLLSNGGNAQSGVAGTTLPQLISVKVVNHDGVPIAGALVTFTAGAGSVSAEGAVPTGSNGVASTAWTLGGTPGGQTATASTPLALQTVIFNATALTAFAASGNVTDPIGDAGEGGADLVGLSAAVAGGTITFTTDYLLSSVSSITELTTLLVDTDQNHLTGHPGVNAGGVDDTANISADYLITIENGQAGLFKYAGVVNSFTRVASTSCSVTNNTPIEGVATRSISCSFTLSQLGNDDGFVNFKATSSTKISANGYTGVQDVITDVGSAPGNTGYPPST